MKNHFKMHWSPVFTCLLICSLVSCLGLRDISLKPGDDLLKEGLKQLENKKLEEANSSFTNALNNYNLANTTDKNAYAWCYYGLGTVAMKKMDWDKALEHYKTAAGYFREALEMEYNGLGWVLVNTGIIYKINNQPAEAKSNLISGLENLEKAKVRDHNGCFLANTTAGFIFLILKDFEKAEVHLLAAENEYRDTTPLNPAALAEIHYNLGLANLNKKDLEKAKQYFLQSGGIFEEQAGTDKKIIGDIDYYIGAIYYEQKDYGQAEKYLKLALVNYNQALALHKDAGNTETVKQMEDQVQRINGVLKGK